MRTARRLVKDEAGVTMALAVIMILLLGVMGAGLLTFVGRDLNTVVEENKGQSAFEVADAGIEAAKHQLASNVDRTKYDNPDSAGDNIQWAETRGGLTLNDLDGDDPDGAGPLADPTPDSANVKITYSGTPGDANEKFTVVSTGTYGTAKRKIEAIFKGVQIGAGGGGTTLGHPVYYTPSNIRVERSITLQGISLFTEQDILIQSPYDDDPFDLSTIDPTHDRAVFERDLADNNGGTLGGGNSQDELGNWYSPGFTTTPGTWNLAARKKSNGSDLNQPGLGAMGKICGISKTDFTSGVCPASSPSIADGRWSFDCTTGPVDLPDSVCPNPPASRGQGLTFINKQPEDDPNQDATTTITFPFPRPTPNASAFMTEAKNRPVSDCNYPRDPTTNVALSPNFDHCYFKGVPGPSDWPRLFPGSGQSDRVIFIDAQNSSTPIQFNLSTSTTDDLNQYSGIIVVWCGDFVQQQDFKGIILNLYGDGSSWGGSTCGPDKGVYTNAGEKLKRNGNPVSIRQTGWVYAAGGAHRLPDGTTNGITRPGIILKNGSTVAFSRQSWSFTSNVFSSPTPPTSFALQSWRELYS